MLVRVSVVLTGIVLCLLLAAPSPSHVKKRGEANDKYGDWYFRGATFEDSGEGRAEDAKDPVNFIFYSPRDPSEYVKERIETHMSDDWDNGAIGGGTWRTDSQIDFYCKVDFWMVWRHLPGRSSDRTDFHGKTRSVPHCGRHHHARFWDDQEHFKGTDHGAGNQWVVGGIHHEKLAYRKVCCVKHKPDRDWDRVRVELVKAMRRHCSLRRWRYHPGADRDFQEKTNFGFIARIALSHRASGCSGA